MFLQLHQQQVSVVPFILTAFVAISGSWRTTHASDQVTTKCLHGPGQCPTTYPPAQRPNPVRLNATSIPRVPFLTPAKGVLIGVKHEFNPNQENQKTDIDAINTEQRYRWSRNHGRDLYQRSSGDDHNEADDETYGGQKKVVFQQQTAFKLDEYCTFQCKKHIYRTPDGSCNNLQAPNWGKSNQCFTRLLAPVYGNSKGAIKDMSVHGHDPLPSPRLVSNVIHDEVNNLDRINRFHMQWGQFLDHDMSFTPFALRPDRLELRCCKDEFHPECETIRVPKNDPFYAQFGEQCIEFVRSHTCIECGQQNGDYQLRDGNHGSREQLNVITAYVDGSVLYGSTSNMTMLFRRLDGSGMLRTSASVSGKELLPLSMSPDDQCTRRPEFTFCFGSGDIRVNQQPGLTAMHLVLMRQHNRLAAGLRKLNPHWDEETLFQQARRIVIAQMQLVSYNEYLPIVVGELVMNHYKLHILKDGFTEYDPKLNPAISNEFHTAAFRFAHSQIDGQMSRVTEAGKTVNFNLRDIFFQPFDILYDRLDDVIRGLIFEPTQSFDPFMHNDVRNHLYKAAGKPFGMDLAAINIQRGRDNGIPGYTKYLKYCYNINVHDWEDLKRFIQKEPLQTLRQLYKSPEDVDLWTGGLVEYRMEGGGMVGPVFSCIIGIQFNRVKFGDRFWFEHKDQVGSFTRKQLQSLRKTRLAKLLCQNSDHIRRIHLNIFVGYTKDMPLVDCDDIPDVDLSLWKDHKHRN